MIEKYTIWHLKILDYFENPEKFDNVNKSKYYMGSPKSVLFEVYPELKGKEKYVDKIVKELYSDGLMTTENLNTTMSASGMVASRTSEMANDFIRFITRK